MAHTRRQKNLEGKTQHGKCHRDHHPNSAFAFLRSYLNHKNLACLLRVCAGLSCYERFTLFTEAGALKQYVNYPNHRALLFAALESRSSLAAETLLTYADLVKILNNARDASYDPDALGPLKRLNGKPGVELEFHRFLARMGNIQMSHQNPIVSIGRAVAMLDVLPMSKRQWLSESMKKTADILAAEFHRILGSAVRDLGHVHLILLIFCRQNFNNVAGNLPALDDESILDEYRLFILLKEVLTLADTRQPFGFSAAEIAARAGGAVTEAQVENYLRSFARQVSAHRNLLQEPAYRVGRIASRLSPLERFPIVEMDRADNLIPNATVFSNAFYHVIDFTLFEELKKIGKDQDYSSFRGAMQELYMQALVAECLPTHICLPERQYGKEHRRGPDITIIDTKRRNLIIVESKSRRMRADTVALMSDATLAENLEDAYDTLLKAPRKIADLYAGIPIYSDLQGHIDQTKGTAPICIVVLSNTVFSLTEIIRLQIGRDPDHPLKEYPYPFCIISLDTFERAVELARFTDLSLAELFEEHWEVSGTFDVSTHIADMFKGRELPDISQGFAASFFWKGEIGCQAPG